MAAAPRARRPAGTAPDPRIERIRDLLKGPTPPSLADEPPPVPLGLTIDVTNTGRLLDLLDELERRPNVP